MAENFTLIPAIDFSLYTSPETKPQFLSDLRNAVVQVGFFYLKNHGISEPVQSQLVAQTVNFFDLPVEEKQRIAIANSKHFLGYTGFTTRANGTIDHRETFTLGIDQPAPGPDEPMYRNLRGPNPWPEATLIPEFRSAIQKYTKQVEQVADNFKVAVAESLDLEPTAFSRLFDDASNDRLMLAKYPLVPGVQGDEVSYFRGLAAHKDSSFLTFLLPATEHKGLEAQNKAGNWIPVPPLPGHLVVNIGRQLEALTKGVCVATTHRVRLHPRDYHDTNGNPLGTRYAFPYFQVVGLDLTPQSASVEVPPHIAGLVKDEEAKSDAKAYFQRYFEDGIGKGIFATRVYRYPLTAQKFYPGLLEELRGTTELPK